MKNTVIDCKSYSSFLEKTSTNIIKEAISKGIKGNISVIFLPFSCIREIISQKDINSINQGIANILTNKGGVIRCVRKILVDLIMK